MAVPCPKTLFEGKREVFLQEPLAPASHFSSGGQSLWSY